VKLLKTLLAALALTAVLSGCSFSPFAASGEELYRLPKLPIEYESLEMQLDELIRNGAEHVSPTSGNNLQSVQMVDLDSDGVEEAVAFLRKNDDEKPMKIYIFRAQEGGYALAYLMEGTSTSIYSISYVDLNGDGIKELLTGLRSSLDVQTLTVFSLAGSEPRTVLTTGYSRYLACDLNGSGAQDLIVIRGDEENVAYADRYAWQDDELILQSSENCAIPVTEVTRLMSGALSGGENAVFLNGEAEEGSITEIFAMQKEKFLRIHTLLAPQSELYPSDINNDGITEVPESVAFPRSDEQGEIFCKTVWHSYDASGKDSVVSCSFYNAADGWSLTLLEYWGDDIGVVRSSASGYNAISFCTLGDGTEDDGTFLTIARFTGNERNYQVMQGDWIPLSQQVDTIYAAKIGGKIDATTLQENFSLITAEWTTGEN